MFKCNLGKRLYSSFYKKSPFEVLNLNTSASTSDIKKRYRDLAKNLHPDKKDTGDLAKFQELVQAYELLIDPNKRSYYLKSGYGWNNEAFSRDVSYPPPGHRPPSYTNAHWAKTGADIENNFVKNTTFISILAAAVVAIGTANLFYFQSSHAALLSAADQHHMKSSHDLKRARTEAKLFGNDRGVKRVIDNRMKIFRRPSLNNSNHDNDSSSS